MSTPGIAAAPAGRATARWYRSGYVWLVLTPLIVSVLGMVLTIVIMSRSGALEQHPDLGQPLGKIYTGSDSSTEAAAADEDDG